MATLSFGTIILPNRKGFFSADSMSVRSLSEVEIASEDSVKRVGGTIGWGAVGGLALGPVGLLAGLLLGGKSKEVTFVAVFKDGRRIFATADAKTFKQLKAAVF